MSGPEVHTHSHTKMADIDDEEAVPVGQDYSNVGNDEILGAMRYRSNSKPMNWEQFFIHFRGRVSEPTADLLSHVKKIDMKELSSLLKKAPNDAELNRCCEDVLQLIKEVSETISIELSEKELRDGTSQQLTERAVVICLFGRFNSGKSTMINAILGNEILPTSMSAQTTTPIKVVHREDLHKGSCTMTGGNCDRCPVLIEKSWKEEMDNALHMTERVCGAQDIQRSLETFDAKVKGNPNYKGKPDLLIEVYIPLFSRTSIQQKVYLVDTQGIGAATTQHREGLAAQFLKQSSAYVYCVKYGETEDLKNQDDYKAVAQKDRSIFTSGRFIVAITHFDEYFHKKRRSLAVEIQKQHIIDGIKAAVGIEFSEKNIICVSGQMALCARLLHSLTQNSDVMNEAEEYLKYCPDYSGPMGQDSKLDRRNIPAISEVLERKSGILDLEKCLKNMVKSSNIIWLQAIYGDCTRFIEDARQSMMSRLVVVQKDGEVVDKIYQERFEIQRYFARLLGQLGKTLQVNRKESDAYAHLEDAYNKEVEDVEEQASQLIASFKKECERKLQGGRYYPKDLQIDVSAFVSRAHKALIQNQMLRHVYAALPLLGETVGQKRQELTSTAKNYADVTVTNKAIAWPPGLTTITGSQIVDSQPNLSEIIKQLPLIQPFEGSRLQKIFHSLWEKISRLFSSFSLNQEDIDSVLTELEQNLISVCKEYMLKAKFDIVEFFFRKGYVDRVIPWLETFIEEIQDNVKVTDEELNNQAKAIHLMKVGVNVCMDVHSFLVELNKSLYNCYRGTTNCQVMQGNECHIQHSGWGTDCPDKEPVKVNTLKTADRIIKRVRRSSVRVAPAVYRSAARATLKRNKKHTEEVMKITEASKQIVSHAETEAKQLLSKKGSSLSVSHSDVEKNLDDDFTGDLTMTCQAAAKRLCGFSRIYPNLLSAMSQNALQELERKDQKKILISVTGGASCGMGTFIYALIGERLLPDEGVSTILREVVIVTNSGEKEQQPYLIQNMVEGPSMQYTGSESIIRALQREPISPHSSSIQVCSSLVPPPTHEQWNINLSCHAELRQNEKERLANIAKTSDAIIHIMTYDSVTRQDQSAFCVLSKVIQNNDSKFRQKDCAAIVVTQLELWFKGYSHPVSKEAFELMFSEIRSTIRKQVWDKAGVYLNEEIIVPLCDKWACTAHHLSNTLSEEDSMEHSKVLAESQNILSENFSTSDTDGYCDSQMTLCNLKKNSHSSNMEMVALRIIKMCCEEASSKLASDFKNYLNSSIYKLEGQRNSYETIIGELALANEQKLMAPENAQAEAHNRVLCSKSIEELKEERSTIERWQQHLADLRETILSLALDGDPK